MPGIIAAIKTASVVIDTVKTTSGLTGSAKTEAIKDAIGKGSLISTDGSITKLLEAFTVEPIIIATKGARENAVIDKILEINTDMFSAFYMQAYRVLTEVMGIEDNNLVINSLGTTKNKFDFIKNNISVESSRDYVNELLMDDIEVSTEDPTIKYDNNTAKDQPLGAILQRNLDVTVKFPDSAGNRHTIVTPIVIKAHVLFVDVKDIVNMMKPNAKDKSFGYRYDEYRAGAIGLSDLIFATDLIKQYKDNKVKDKNNLLEIMNNRTMSGNAKAIRNGYVGFEKNYNMLIITEEDKISLDAHINGDTFKEKYKEELLEQAHAMTCTVLDNDYERAIILTKDIAGTSNISFKSLSKKKGDSDLSELVKAILNNKPPVF